MTDLSPAAQQVFWEFNRAASGKPDDWHYMPAIAAALRAAAKHSIPDESVGYWVYLPRLLAIAAELDSGANN